MKVLTVMNLMHDDDLADAVYGLVDVENKECLDLHVCSSVHFALGDLISGRPERIKELQAKFGEFCVEHKGGTWKPTPPDSQPAKE